MKKKTISKKSTKKTQIKRKKREIKGKPLENTSMVFTAFPEGNKPEVNYAMLWNYVKTSPELTSIVSAISEDILSDGWKIVPAAGKSSGRNNIIAAEKFLEENFAKQEFMSFWMDALITGDAYLWKSKLTQMDIEKAANRTFPRTVKHLGATEMKTLQKKISRELANELIKSTDEDIVKTRAFRSVASSTMLAKWDKFGNVLYYSQRVGPGPMQIEKFTPEEIIHYRYMKADGKFFGFTPMITLLQEMNILNHIKNYAQFMFEKGGVPPFLFILEEEQPNTPNYKAFVQSVQQYGLDTNKHKQMVVTGKVDVKPIGTPIKDMSYQDLAQYVTRVIVMAWNIPSSRLSDLLVAKGAKGAVMSTEGYYRKISHLQDVFEDLINTQLLSEFNVKLRFNKSYLQDEVREVQTLKIKADICEQLKGQGLVNNDYCWDLLDIDEKFRGSGRVAKPKTGMLNQDLINNHQTMTDSPDKLQEDRDKQTAALRQKP